MPPFATIHLDPHHPKREVDLVVDHYYLGYRDLSEGEEWLKRLPASIHEGLRLNKMPRPVTDPERPFAITSSLDPAGSRQGTRDRRPGMDTTLSFNTTRVTGQRCRAQSVDHRKPDVVAG
jgi:hypothetical protein